MANEPASSVDHAPSPTSLPLDSSTPPKIPITLGKIVVTGDLAIAINYIRKADKSVDNTSEYGGYSTYMTISYTGAALHAEMLCHIRLAKEKIEPAMSNEQILESIEFAMPNERILESTVAFPVFSYIFREYQEKKDSPIRFRLNDSLGANRPTYPLLSTRVALGYLNKIINGDPEILVSDASVILINDNNLGYREKGWKWVDHVNPRSIIVCKIKHRRELPNSPQAEVRKDPRKSLADLRSKQNQRVIEILDTAEYDETLLTYETGYPSRPGTTRSDNKTLLKEIFTRTATPVVGEGKDDNESRRIEEWLFCESSLLHRLTKISQDDTFKNQVIAVISVHDLRRGAVSISRSLSWERTAQSIVSVLLNKEHPEANDSCGNARYVVVSLSPNGAVVLDRQARKATLCFSDKKIEGDYVKRGLGDMRGFDSCLAVSVAQGMTVVFPTGCDATDDLWEPLKDYVQRGIKAARKLYDVGLVVEGNQKYYLQTKSSKTNGELDNSHSFPFKEVAKVINASLVSESDVTVVDVPVDFSSYTTNDSEGYFESTWWSFLDQFINKRATDKSIAPEDASKQIALQVLKCGINAFRKDENNHKSPVLFPYAEFNKMLIVDRREIEDYRNLRGLFDEYSHSDPSTRSKPLSVAVFGAPGSGKSFGVEQIAQSLGVKHKLLTFNIAQFKDPSQLYQALHEVRDTVLSGDLPFVFWDEFDSSLEGRMFGWLKYFLAPMQDGKFVEGQVAHPIGRSIFIFAGSLFHSSTDIYTSVDALRKQNPVTRDEQYLDTLAGKQDKWRAEKGDDFKSRLEGMLNIEGAHELRGHGDRHNKYIRRALFVRGLINKYHPALFSDADILRIADPVACAFLFHEQFSHGTRSLEKIILMSALNGKRSFNISALPADSQLLIHTGDVRAFESSYRD